MDDIGITIENESITVQTDICSYYFEFPTGYNPRISRVTDSYLNRYSSYFLQAEEGQTPALYPTSNDKVETVPLEYAKKTIGFSIWDNADKPGLNENGKTRLESDLLSNQRFEDYVFISRAPVIVSGVKGEKITYYESKIPLFASAVDWVGHVYFEYDGLIWQIEVFGDKDLEAELKSDLEYVISSFKILPDNR